MVVWARPVARSFCCHFWIDLDLWRIVIAKSTNVAEIKCQVSSRNGVSLQHWLCWVMACLVYILYSQSAWVLCCERSVCQDQVKSLQIHQKLLSDHACAPDYWCREPRPKILFLVLWFCFHLLPLLVEHLSTSDLHPPSAFHCVMIEKTDGLDFWVA